MRFCHWYSSHEAELAAPAEPGMLQVKTTKGLRNYPSGKSAMVHYEFTENVRDAISRFALLHPTTDFVYRHLIEEVEGGEQSNAVNGGKHDIKEMELLAKQLTERFIERFGCEPRNEESPTQ